ncbi:hypothetical protein AM1_D0142 (plasmid) [Acaryochloris marina MBIC11017]|uniref:Uncharacterized protein n=1 Tax=Acaryochloris marina (strain MBIC 11017) TaxID=329726 RepID=A8ZNQ1_ACAM1|nr:hypothetical protein AM1_D0142 [Acaryochloris marina MBIC11017]
MRIPIRLTWCIEMDETMASKQEQTDQKGMNFEGSVDRLNQDLDRLA